MSFFVDFLPLIAFFATFKLYGILPATGVLIVLTLLCAGWQYHRTGKVPMSQLITAGIVAVFGGLTLVFHDERFIKMKPTIIQLLFASAIIIGQRIGKNPLRMMFEKTIQLTEQGWRILTRNFSLFFILMAGVNELVWRNVPTETWVNFKVFGVLGLTVIYIFLQMVWIQRFAITPPQQDDTPSESS
jgi:intracellular septation protein